MVRKRMGSFAVAGTLLQVASAGWRRTSATTRAVEAGKAGVRLIRYGIQPARAWVHLGFKLVRLSECDSELVLRAA